MLNCKQYFKVERKYLIILWKFYVPKSMIAVTYNMYKQDFRAFIQTKKSFVIVILTDVKNTSSIIREKFLDTMSCQIKKNNNLGAVLYMLLYG